MKGKTSKTILVALLCIVAVVGLIVLRVYLDARREFKAAKLAELRADMWEAILHYRLAISAYTPFAAYPERAAERLRGIAEEAERSGDTLLALEAYRAIRSGFLSARSFYTPKHQWIEQAESEIVRLLILRGEPQKIYGDMPKEQLERLIRQEMNRYQPPNHLLSFAAIVALFGWAISACLGLYHLAKRSYKTALTRFLIFVILYAVWAFCLIKA